MNAGDWIVVLMIQCWQLAALALIIWILVRTLGRRRPHLAHVLCTLVLIKALIPPLWSVNWSPFTWIMDYSKRCVADSSNHGLIVSSKPNMTPFDGQPPISDIDVNSIAPVEFRTFTFGATPEGMASMPWSFVLAVWMGTVIVAWAITAIRYGGVLRQLSRAKPLCFPELDVRLAQLVRKLGVKRSVKLKILDAPLGPAVLGFIQPTIVLPALIVRGRSIEQIEPLLAHELIHIRRGDLWWAVLQVLARGLFWFHPAIRWADSQLSQAAERCCDQETIRSLNCSPTDYARCLLDVLEHKHRLHVATALPGVRPLDITRDRLERVMKTEKTNVCHRPIWGWLVLVVGCALVLPGAASVRAQQDNQMQKDQSRFALSFKMYEASLDFLAANETWQTFQLDELQEASGFVDLLDGSKPNKMPNQCDVRIARFDKSGPELLMELQLVPAENQEADGSETAIEIAPKRLSQLPVKFHSSPTLVTSLNRLCELISGGEVPVINANQEIEFRTFGTQVTANPNELENQQITLQLSFELSELQSPLIEDGEIERAIVGVRFETRQKFSLAGAIAFAIPQPHRDNQLMIVIVQCSKIDTDADRNLDSTVPQQVNTGMQPHSKPVGKSHSSMGVADD